MERLIERSVKKMSVAMMQNMELILTVGISFLVGIGYGVWLANDIREEMEDTKDAIEW